MANVAECRYIITMSRSSYEKGIIDVRPAKDDVLWIVSLFCTLFGAASFIFDMGTHTRRNLLRNYWLSNQWLLS